MADKFTVRDLELYYGDFHALKNINMTLPEHEITAFIGPSGCGKCESVAQEGWHGVSESKPLPDEHLR